MITLSDEVCQVKMLFRICGRKTHRDGKCIFHIENKSDEEAEIFEEKFKNDLKKMEDDETIKVLDFTEFIFPKLINFQKYSIKKSIDFRGAKFNKGAYFSMARFNNEPNFQMAKFNNEANFAMATFNNGARFFKAEFNNKAYFFGTIFNNKVVDFGYVKFNNEADFSQAKFNSGAFFKWAEFLSKVSFRDTIFSKEHLTNFNYVEFYKQKYVKLRGDLSNVSFLYTDITEVEFFEVEWAKKGRRHIVVDELHIGKDTIVTYGAVTQLYRRLRKNYENSYRFAEAGDFFIGEMEMSRLDVKPRFKNEKVKMIELWLKRNFSFLTIYKYLSLYGESYSRPAILAFIIIVFYPFIACDLFFNLLSHWIFNSSFKDIQDFTMLRPNMCST